MRKERKQKFLERKESIQKSHGNPIYSYVSRIDFGNMAYTAKPKQEYCCRWDYKQTMLWRYMKAHTLFSVLSYFCKWEKEHD